jgi:integrase
MQSQSFPLTVTEKGVSAVIRKSEKIKNGNTHQYFIVEYFQYGKRKQVWRSSLEDAEAVATDACRKIANGDQSALELRNGERFAYTRAIEVLAPFQVHLDTACREYADALRILDGKASITEACREWIKRNAVMLPKITVADAVAQVQQRAKTEKKSDDRQHELEVLLNRFARDFQCEVHTITPSMIAGFLSCLELSERSKRNYQDAIKHLNRWLVLHGYLAKGTDWNEGVQKYSARKHGEVTIYTPQEIKAILETAKGWQMPFIAIGAFSALRASEIYRLDWSQIELIDQSGESFIEVRSIENTKSDQRRRLVPISDNLKAWLKTCQQKSGPICPLGIKKRPEKHIVATIKQAGVAFKKNALRHSGISYRVAHTGDIARVADDSGNSVSIIRSNYLRRVKQSQAAEWFNIMPNSNN